MMINPPKPPDEPKPTKALFKSLYQDVKAAVSVENQTLCKSDENEMHMSRNNNDTEMNQRGGIKSVNFVANL